MRKARSPGRSRDAFGQGGACRKPAALLGQRAASVKPGARLLRLIGDQVLGFLDPARRLGVSTLS
jgi:hypothetical protein